MTEWQGWSALQPPPVYGGRKQKLSHRLPGLMILRCGMHTSKCSGSPIMRVGKNIHSRKLGPVGNLDHPEDYLAYQIRFPDLQW